MGTDASGWLLWLTIGCVALVAVALSRPRSRSRADRGGGVRLLAGVRRDGALQLAEHQRDPRTRCRAPGAS